MIRQLADLVERIQKLRQREVDRERPMLERWWKKVNKDLRFECRHVLGITLPDDFDGDRYELFPGIVLCMNYHQYGGPTMLALLERKENGAGLEYPIRKLKDIAYILENRGYALPPK